MPNQSAAPVAQHLDGRLPGGAGGTPGQGCAESFSGGDLQTDGGVAERIRARLPWQSARVLDLPATRRNKRATRYGSQRHRQVQRGFVPPLGFDACMRLRAPSPGHRRGARRPSPHLHRWSTVRAAHQEQEFYTAWSRSKTCKVETSPRWVLGQVERCPSSSADRPRLRDRRTGLITRLTSVGPLPAGRD